MVESGLVSTSASSLGTLGRIPSGPIDLCVSKGCSESLTISPWILGASFCSLPLSSSAVGSVPRDDLSDAGALDASQWAQGMHTFPLCLIR